MLTDSNTSTMLLGYCYKKQDWDKSTKLLKLLRVVEVGKQKDRHPSLPKLGTKTSKDNIIENLWSVSVFVPISGFYFCR